MPNNIRHGVLVTLLILLSPILSRGQSQNHNYISEKVFTNADGTYSNETITYYDGLGRPVETVRKGAWTDEGTPIGDFVNATAYDACGRPFKTILPAGMSGNGGAFASLAAVQQAASSLYSDSVPYTRVQYDSIPIERVRSVDGPGILWQLNGVETGYSYHSNRYPNTDWNPGVITAAYSGNTEVVITIPNDHIPYYLDGAFRIEEVTDEDGRITSRFMDDLGNVAVERRALPDSTICETYYCYDNAGRLIAVLPPELKSRLEASTNTVFTLSSSVDLKDYGYFYRYDAKGQLIAKKLPGADWIYYVYDKGGRLVYSQDGNQRRRNEWSFVLADRLGRECIKGTVIIPSASMSPFNDPLGDVNVFVQRNDPATSMLDYGYLAVNFDLHGADVLSVTWYDDYSFLGEMDGIPSAASTTSPTRYDTSASASGLGDKYQYSGAGRMTGKYEKVLGETDGNVYLWTVLYYDSKGRVTQESHSTHRGGTRRTNTGYDFVGHPTKSRTITQDTLAGDLTELYTYSYDAWGRPLTVTHKLGEARPVTLHNYSYDGAGRIDWDFRNGDADLATRYTYNVRNSLTSIKVGGSAQQGTLGETFTEMLYYESPRGGAPLLGVQYAGNVSSMSWMAGSDGVMRSYDFSYDGLSRLTGAAYTDNDNGTGLYTRGYTYDLNGNMTSLTTPSGTTNQSYSGNQFSGTGIDYDFNGNLTDNLGCGLTQVKYNILNLPESCHYSYSVGYHQMVGQESYLYSVNGVKLQTMDPMQIVLPGQPDTRERTDYVGNLVYDRTSLKKILVPGGYVEVSSTGNNYRFFITDHLGNNRLVTDASGTILQTNHYDPYGESLPAGASVDSGNPYKWGNKEYDVFLGSYDFGARYYASSTFSVPVWTTMDPLCEKYYSISPYAYCAGNPVNMVDYEGKLIVFVNGFLGFGSPEGGEDYWTTSFVERAMKSLQDDNPYYCDIHHCLFSTAESRRDKGYEYAKWFLKKVRRQLSEGETIKFVTHSMGAAFTEGMADYLIEHGYPVEMLFHFEPYQAARIKTVGEASEILTVDIQTTGDWVISIINAGLIQNADGTVSVDKEDADLFEVHRKAIDCATTWEQVLKYIQEYLEGLHSLDSNE